MAALACEEHDPSDRLPERNRLLRMVDAWAEWQMRQSLRVIARGKPYRGKAYRSKAWCSESPGRLPRH